MEKAKRARKAETPKQPSPSLRLRAPYLYPDPTAIKDFISGADAVHLAEGNTYGHDSASVHMARRGRRTWHVQTLLVSGNREISRFDRSVFGRRSASGR
jgi:hypothetical protein